MKNQSIIFFIVFFISLINYLQELPKIIPPSLGIAQLQKYIDSTVNHNTGIPNTLIPLHKTNTSNLSIPINISYHASEFKIDYQIGTVGLGLVLNAGGLISRKIVNKPDEYCYYLYPNRPIYSLKQEAEEDYIQFWDIQHQFKSEYELKFNYKNVV